MNVDMPQKAPIVMDPAAEGGMEVGTVTPTKMNVAQAYMNPGGSQSRGVASINQAFGQPDPAAVSGPNFPGREELAKALLMRQQAMQPPATAQGVPQPNPTLPGALPPSSTIPSPENLKPDQRLAQDTSRSMSDIGAAPQVQQIRKAPAVGQPPEAVPGYVPPEPGQVPGAPLVRMTPREVQLQQWLAANQGNPYAAMKVAPELQSLQAERTQRQNEANERFKASITQQTKQMEMRQQALVDQAKRITDVEHTQQQTAAGRLIDPYDKQYVLGPDGVARPLKVEGQNSKEMPQVKLTEVQQKALVFHDWARLGNEGMDGKEALLAKGLQQELLGKVPFAGNSLQSAEYRRARNAANNFVLAFMRDTSGAAYGAKEMYDHASALLPKFGDDAGTLADKAKQREAFVNNLYGSMGSARQIADWSIKQQKEKEQTKQYAIDSEMKDVMPKGIGDTKTNIKTGVRRVWNGKNWLEM